jgi:hypothetical protein
VVNIFKEKTILPLLMKMLETHLITLSFYLKIRISQDTTNIHHKNTRYLQYINVHIPVPFLTVLDILTRHMISLLLS